MRSYMIEELSSDQIAEVQNTLVEKGWTSAIDGLYKIPVPVELLSPEQVEHTECGPFYMAVETGRNWVKMELLVRATQILRCSCIAYATPAQRAAAIDTLDELIKSDDITI